MSRTRGSKNGIHTDHKDYQKVSNVFAFVFEFCVVNKQVLIKVGMGKGEGLQQGDKIFKTS